MRGTNRTETHTGVGKEDLGLQREAERYWFDQAKATSISTSKPFFLLAALVADRKKLVIILSIMVASAAAYFDFVLYKVTPGVDAQTRRHLCEPRNDTVMPNWIDIKEASTNATNPPTDAPTKSPTDAPAKPGASTPTKPPTGPTTPPPTGTSTEPSTAPPTSSPTKPPTEAPQPKPGAGPPTKRPPTKPTETPTNTPNQPPTDAPTEPPSKGNDTVALHWNDTKGSVPVCDDGDLEETQVNLIKGCIFALVFPILVQMTAILFTKLRATTNLLFSQREISNFVTLQDLHDVHIFLGYSITGLVVLLGGLSISYEVTKCWQGEGSAWHHLVWHNVAWNQLAWNNLNTNVMISGIALLVLFTMNAVVAYFRFHNYQYFYMIHVVFVGIAYFATVVHTLGPKRDDFQQSYTWFWGILLYYTCDALVDFSLRRKRVRLIDATVSCSNNLQGPRSVLLSLEWPASFQFKAGYFVYVRLKAIDETWHPFTVASVETNQVQLLISENGNWTHQLISKMEGFDPNCGDIKYEFEFMGPYGAALVGGSTHVLAFGMGSGFAPVLALLKGHVKKVCQMSPQELFHIRDENRTAANAAENSQRHQTPAKIAWLQFSRLFFRVRIMDRVGRERRTNPTEEELLWKHVRILLECLLPPFGILIITAFVFTVNNKDLYLINAYLIDMQMMGSLLLWIVFTCLFIFIWECDIIRVQWIILDFALSFSYVVLALLAMNQEAKAQLENLMFCICYFISVAWFTLRCWYMAVRPHNRSWIQSGNRELLERVDIVWSERNSKVVRLLLPELSMLWGDLTDHLGPRAPELCRLSIYLTDDDTAERRSLIRLVQELEGVGRLPAGCLHLGRANFEKIVDEHTIELAASRSNQSVTLLTYCGGSAAERKVRAAKIKRDFLAAATENEKHQMDFVAESFGPSAMVQRSSGLTDYSHPQVHREDMQLARLNRGQEEQPFMEVPESNYGSAL